MVIRRDVAENLYHLVSVSPPNRINRQEQFHHQSQAESIEILIEFNWVELKFVLFKSKVGISSSRSPKDLGFP